MDKGYHDNGWLAELAERGVRTYIPERRQKTRRWTDKPVEYEPAFRANRRRVRGHHGRQLNRWRSERCERTFAHVCETGGGRRSWLRGQTNVSKAHTLKCAAYNLGLLLRKVWGMCKPRSAKAGSAGLFLLLWAIWTLVAVITRGAKERQLHWLSDTGILLLVTVTAIRCIHSIRSFWKNRRSLTGCYVLLRFCAHLGQWSHSFTRLFALIRSALWQKLELRSLLICYGTADGGGRFLGTPQQAYLAGFG